MPPHALWSCSPASHAISRARGEALRMHTAPRPGNKRGSQRRFSAGIISCLFPRYKYFLEIFPKRSPATPPAAGTFCGEKTSVPREVSVRSRRMYTHKRHFAPCVLPRWQVAVFLKKVDFFLAFTGRSRYNGKNFINLPRYYITLLMRRSFYVSRVQFLRRSLHAA